MIRRESGSMVDHVEIPRLQRRAPIAGALERPGFRLNFLPFIGIATIQLGEISAATDVARRLGADLPGSCASVEAGALLCAWLAPREWLLVGPEDDLTRFSTRTHASTATHSLFTDLTHACAAFEISGPGAREALSAHCPLDLSDRTFPVGSAARSLLSSAKLFVCRKQDQAHAPAFLLIVDQTMAAYAMRMFAGPDSGPPCGARIDD
jgi:heterotetrameric sarcosine oxidase gamma subunit